MLGKKTTKLAKATQVKNDEGYWGFTASGADLFGYSTCDLLRRKEPTLL